MVSIRHLMGRNRSTGVPVTDEVDDSAVDLNSIGITVGSERSSVTFDVLNRYEAIMVPYQRTGLSILDITAQVHETELLWARRFPDAEINIVYSRTDGRVDASGKANTHSSKTFGADYWLGLAQDISPNVVLSDGKISVYHQMQMFRILFPVLQPGGTLVLENAGGKSSHLHPNDEELNTLIFDFFYSLSKAKAGINEHFSRRDEFWDYCDRNIESIEYYKSNIIVRKRTFHQLQLTAVPFRALARSYELLDSPSAYPRIPIHIYGSQIMASRVNSILEAVAGKVPPSAEIGILVDAKIVGAGIITVEDRYIVKESFINQNHTARRTPFYKIESSEMYVTEDSIATYRSMPPTELFVAAKQTWDANYGHWIVDTFPRLVNLSKAFDLSSAHIVLNGNRSKAMKKVFSDSLELLGVGVDNLEWTDHRPVHFESLVYATPMSVPPLIKSEYSIRNLESVTSLIPPESRAKYVDFKRIYLSRNKYPRRRLDNEEQILPILLERGYSVVYPEELSLFDQIGLFANADYVVGNMGAAFSSLAFSPQGVRVFALATEKMLHDYFYDIVCHKSGSYMGLQGVSETGPTDIGANFRIDVNEFTRLLEVFDSIGGS